MSHRGLFVVVLAAMLLAACAGPSPTVRPAVAPSPTGRPIATPLPESATPPPAPSLAVTLATDSQHYEPSKVQLRLTLTNHSEEPIYLPICGPWAVLHAADQQPIWFIECEIDYLGHEVEPGESYSDTLSVYLQAGSYRVHTRVYGDCTLGAPKSISARETYYGEFGDCATWEEAVSEPFGVE